LSCQRIVGTYGAAVLAHGHCGSCTSATARDAVAMARLGLPVVATVIPRFREEAAQVARAAGMPDVPVLVLPGAMTQLSAAERAEVAAQVAGQVVASLIGTS
jgi:mono/diheme cytochrome c family protein